MNAPKIPDWHSPHNLACAQNADPLADCTCKRPRTRKPYRVCKCRDFHAPHGVSPELVLEVHPNGLLVIREKRRKAGSARSITLGEVYAHCLKRDAFKARMEKARAKKGGKR